MKKANNLVCTRKKLVLFDYRFWRILASREGIRRTVHHLPHRCFSPVYLMDEASAVEGATCPVRALVPKGYRTMLAVHDQFTRQMRNRLKTTVMGLGLVRLLQDVKRTDEARTTLYSLESGFQGIAGKSDKPSRKLKGSNGVTRTGSCSPMPSSTRIAAAIDREARQLDERSLAWGNKKVLCISTERLGSARQRFVEVSP